MTFGTLFVDEAAQALEAACWIAIAKARRVVLAGDHCQLPPTVKSVEAMRGGLGVTLMERIAATNPHTVTMLNVQYRMNEAIMRFSSQWFYGGKVQSAPEVRHRGILDFDTPRSTSRSLIQSTAILLCAHTSTWFSRRSVSHMASTSVVVLPVPGGPWTMATSGEPSTRFTAASCAALSHGRLTRLTSVGLAAPCGV